MLRIKPTRGIALLLAFCMLFAMLPMNVIASGNEIGDTATTPTKEPPAPVEGAIWVLTDSIECKKLEHTHTEKCFYQSCDHADGHLTTCYSESIEYALCEHEDKTEHTADVTLTDVVEINGTNVSWKTNHPAYSVVYAVYKTAYDEAYASAKFMKDTLAKAAGIAALAGKSFCYTTSASATPDKCTHGECSDFRGACYSKLCVLEEHQHATECYQYTWTLKSDVNKNGIADDVDTYHSVKFVSEGEVVHEATVLTGMPTPAVQNPTKAADAQYTYEFVGWDTPVADTVTESVVYTAVYNNITNKYTVTWVDEDGTELEVDKNVEYGKMPNFDGENPVKAGDNTVKYTFAGWTPAVDTVTGDVTYTAAYTTQDIFEVKFFIDGELQKTEYVVDGETVQEYAPTREHYELTEWKNGDELYDFTDVVTEHIELHASWALTEATVTVKAPNAAYSWNGTGVYQIGEDVIIEIVPQEGYAVSKVLVNGTSVSLNYDDCVATVQFTPDSTTEKYFVDVKTSKVQISLNAAEMNLFGDLSAEAIFNAVYNKDNSYPELSFNDVKVEYKAFSIELFGKTYEWWTAPGADVSLKNFLDQYGLGQFASYIPTENLPHEFGAESVEQVRISFAGNEKCPAASAETTVALIDLRTPTKVNVNSKVTVTFGATEEEILKAAFLSVTTDKAKAVVTEDYKEMKLTIASLNAGTYTATISFPGNVDYAASVAEVEVTIKQAAGKIDIQSANNKFGTDVKFSDLTEANANYIQIAMGMYLGDNASANAGTLVHVNIPSLIDVDSIENETIKAMAQQLLDRINGSLSKNMSVDELREALENALPYLEMVEESGYAANLNTQSIEAMIMVLEQMSKLEGVNEFEIKVTIGQDITLHDAGVYLVAGVISDANYTTAFDANFAVITPDGMRAELGWAIEDENGIITIEALRNGYDLGATVTNVAEGNAADAAAHIKNYFFGVNKDGVLIITENQTKLEIGAYTEFSFIMDLGNTMYYAEPIARAFIVAADVVNVDFVDGNGKVNNDRIFEFGEDATMNAIAKDRHGNVKEGNMSYLYMGIQANGEFYRDTTAPTRPGTYTVIALFIGEEEMNVGAAVGALVIKPIVPDFEVEDTTVQYDGNEHMVTLKDETGMEKVYIVIDEEGNVNLVLPEEIALDVFAAGATLNEVLEQLDKIDFDKLPEELTEYYNDLVSEVKDTIRQLKKEYGVKSVTLNGAFPVEIGKYDFYIFGFKDIEHEAIAEKATLTIHCVHKYDHDCDTDCNICGGEREVSKHKATYVDRYESTCVKQGYEKIRCKACHEVLSETTLPLSEEHVYYNGACLLCGAKEHCEHNYVVVKELAPTCAEAGYVWTECSECGAEKNYEVGEPSGEHGDTYIDRYESTCVKKGYEKTRCKVCHEVMTEVELPLSEEHVYHNGACLLCGKSEKCQHEYETEKELAPTCGEAGYVWTKCSKCGAEKNYEVGEPTGKHTFDNDCDAKCNGCEHTRTVGEHKYDNACDADCNICGAERTPAAHVYDNNCDADCNVCKETRTPAEHVYDHACDVDCNECGEKRTPADHAYDNACDADCNVCKATRTPADHQYDNKCDASCNVCGATREVGEHIYDNKCDINCNECGTQREVGNHVYDHDCDKDCNECGDERVPSAHKYDNACDTKCNVCDAEREVEDHKYEGVVDKNPDCGNHGEKVYTCTECGDSYSEPLPATGEHTYANACDTECDVCGAAREVEDHVYDNACDAECNECGTKRQVGEHSYKNACDADCDVCGTERTPAEHVYDDEYDADCNVCGATREVAEKPEECTHVYDHDCDAACNKCGELREVAAHVYDNECDTTCNVCGATREAESAHAYQNACDADCDICGATREVTHAYDDEYDADCNECGETREVSQRPTTPDNDDDKTDSPQTGDNSHLGLWIILMLASVAGLFILFVTRRKQAEENN